MQKNLDTHKKDEEGYKRQFFAFKKKILDFMYKSLDSSKPFSSVHEAKEVECNGTSHEQQEEEPHDLRRRGKDLKNEEVEEQQ